MKRGFFRTSVLNFMAALAFLGTGDLWGTDINTSPYADATIINGLDSTITALTLQSLVMQGNIQFLTQNKLNLSAGGTGTSPVIITGNLSGTPGASGTLELTHNQIVTLSGAMGAQTSIKRASLSGGATLIAEKWNLGSTSTIGNNQLFNLAGATVLFPGIIDQTFTGQGGQNLISVTRGQNSIIAANSKITFSSNSPISISGGGELVLSSSGVEEGVPSFITIDTPTSLTGGSKLVFRSQVVFGTNHQSLSMDNSGCIFDISGLNLTAPSVPTIAVPMTAGADVLNMAINPAGYSTSIDVTGNDLTAAGLTVNVTPQAGIYKNAIGKEYTILFGGANNLGIGTITTLQSAPGTMVEFSLSNVIVGNNILKFTLIGAPKIRIPKPISATSSHGVQASSVNMATSTLHTSIQYARRAANSNESGPSSPPGFFRGNPFRAPDLERDFLNTTTMAMTNSAQENMERWVPLRTDKTGIWAQPFGMTLRQVSNQGAPGFHSRVAGLMIGMDHKISYDTIVGVTFGYARTNVSFDANAGASRVDDKFATLFGTWFRNNWYLEGSLLGGMETYRSSRNVGVNILGVNVGPSNMYAMNRHGGYEISPHVGAGYTFNMRDSKLQVYAGFDYVYVGQQGYRETGADPLNLTIKRSRASMVRSEGGLDLSKAYEYKNFKWTPGFKLSVVNKKPIKKGLIQTSAEGTFESTTVTTTNISPGIESTVEFADGYFVSGSWTGEFGSQYNSQEASVKFTKKL